MNTPTYSYSTEENGNYTDAQPTNVGTYWVKAVVKGTANYEGLEAKKPFKILPKTYPVTYTVGNKGSGTVTAGTKTQDVDPTLSSDTFTRASYKQIGWATSDGGEKVYDLGGKYTENKAITLYPVWEDITTKKLVPEIIDGHNQIITVGEKRDLTFRSSAAFSDFIRVAVDGTTLDPANYTVKEGSTIVTLKADYVATLSTGKHTISIVSESGIATTVFTVELKTETKNTTFSPATGDNSSIFLWFVILIISGGVLIGTKVYFKKKTIK